MLANKLQCYDDASQDRVIAELDRLGETIISEDIQSMVVMSARLKMTTGTTSRVLAEFAVAVNVSEGSIAERIISEMYPANPIYWPHYDEQHQNRISNAKWLEVA